MPISTYPSVVQTKYVENSLQFEATHKAGLSLSVSSAVQRPKPQTQHTSKILTVLRTVQIVSAPPKEQESSVVVQQPVPWLPKPDASQLSLGNNSVKTERRWMGIEGI